MAHAVAVQLESSVHGEGKISTQCASHAAFHYINGACHIVGGNGCAAGHSLDHHEAEGVGQARKDEDIGR